MVRSDCEQRRRQGATDAHDSMRNVRLTRKYAGCLNGIDLSHAHVGDLLTVPERDAALLIAEHWAELVAVPGMCRIPPVPELAPAAAIDCEGDRAASRHSSAATPRALHR